MNVPASSGPEKMITAALVALPLILLKPQHVTWLYIVLGHAHFLITYWYQWRAGLINVVYATWFVVALLFFYAYIHAGYPLEGLMFLAGFTFGAHFILDEYGMFIKPHSWIGLLELSIPFTMYTGFLLKAIYRIPVIPLAIGLTTVLLAAWVAASLILRRRPTPMSIYMGLLTLPLLTVGLAGWNIPVPVLFGSVILFHYTSWYIHYYWRVRDRGTIAPYFGRIALVNAIAICGFLLYQNGTGERVLRFAYEPTFFYVWTTMHILFASAGTVKRVYHDLAKPDLAVA